MKTVFVLALLLTLLLAPTLSHAETPEAAVKRTFKQWQIFGSAAEGDLNNDKQNDFAAILQQIDPKTGEALAEQKSAKFVVFFGDKKGLYELKVDSPKASCVGCGGMKAPFGEPLGEVSIEKGIVKVQYEGGSREMFTDVLKWRWDSSQKDFLLIGRNYQVVDTMGQEPENVLDVNFSTLKAERTVGSKKKSCKVPAKLKGQKLTNFNFADDETREALTELCK